MRARGGHLREGGFTLIEALVVVAVTALVGGLVVPKVQQGVETLALRQSSAVLAANLRIARAYALRSGEPVTFGVDPDGRRYGWIGRIESGLPAGQRVTISGAERVLFFGDGTSNGADLQVGQGPRRIDIHVDPATGAVTIAR